MRQFSLAPLYDRQAQPPTTPRALPLLDATAAAALGGPAEASRHAALRRQPQGPAGGLRLARAMR